MAKNKEISGQSGAFRFVFVRHGFLKRYRKRYRKALAGVLLPERHFPQFIKISRESPAGLIIGGAFLFAYQAEHRNPSDNARRVLETAFRLCI